MDSFGEGLPKYDRGRYASVGLSLGPGAIRNWRDGLIWKLHTVSSK